MRDYRLGDIIDDYCVKCKQIMNHAVVSMLNAEPAKVRCRTCHSDHDYRHEQPPPPKVDASQSRRFSRKCWPRWTQYGRDFPRWRRSRSAAGSASKARRQPKLRESLTAGLQQAL